MNILINRGVGSVSRIAFGAVLAACLLAVTGCQAPATTESAPASVPATSAATEVVRSCQTDADCAIKNVGNCCGYYPSCVNVDSPTDPEGVKAQCAKTGMASVCGFPVLAGCQCVAGQCEDQRAMVDPIRQQAPVDH